MNLRFVLLALVQIFVLPRLLCAQLPPRLERCFPYPTFAQEISAMHGETKPPGPEPRTSSKVVIASVKFAPGTNIPEYVRGRITWSIKSPRKRRYSDERKGQLRDATIWPATRVFRSLSRRSNCSRRSLSLTSSARSSTRCNVRRRRHIAVLHPLHADLMVLLVRRNLLKTRHKNL